MLDQDIFARFSSPASTDSSASIWPDLGLDEPQRMNLYAFSLNNPVRYFDPDGRDTRAVFGTFTPSGSGQGGPHCAPKDPTIWCNNTDGSSSEETKDDDTDESSEYTETKHSSETESILDGNITELIEWAGTFGKVGLERSGSTDDELVTGKGSATFKVLEANVAGRCTSSGCEGKAGAKAGVLEVEGEICGLFVCVSLGASVGPQLSAEASVGAETRVKVGAGLVGVGGGVRVRDVPIACS